MAVARGMVATTDIAASSDLVVDMADKVLLLEDDKNQMIKMVRKLAKKPTTREVFNWQDDQIQRFTDVLGAAIADGTTTTITVTNRDRWQPNDLGLIPSTGEIVKFTTVTGASGSGTVTVVRGAGGTAAAAANTAAIVKVGSSWGQGSSARDANNVIISTEQIKNNNFNYTQVERTNVAVTGTELAVGQAGGLYSGDPLKYQSMIKGMEHAKKMNATCYFGKRAVSGNDYKTGGMIEFITQTSGTTTLNAANIDTDLATFFRYGNYNKTLFTTRRVAARLTANAMGNGTVQVIDPGDKYGDIDAGRAFGTSVRHWTGDAGEFDIIVDDVLGDSAFHAGYGLFIDTEDMAYRFIPGRDTKLYVDAQLPDVDGKVSYYLTEWGIQRGLAARHGMWTAVA